MPQMYPMNWLFLFFFFSMIFILFNILTYYNYIPQISNNTKKNNKNIISMNWKW